MENKDTSLSDYLPTLEEEVGEIITAEEYSPSVYYIEALSEEDVLLEYYVVLDTAPLAAKVQAYGKKMDGLRLFAQGELASGWHIVQYEVSKYNIAVKGSPLPEEIFRDMTLHAMELYPEYFGTFPVPFHTPHGCTLRYRTLANGIYWLETSACKEMLAVCFPIWNAELSTAAAICGKVMDCDKAARTESTTPYRFFPSNVSCVPIYELMQTRREWEGTVICSPALMNAIWEYVPAYAMSMNGQKLPESKFVLLDLLEDMGLGIMPQPDEKQVIGMFPDAGLEFMLLK